jgi:hypothetical protein
MKFKAFLQRSKKENKKEVINFTAQDNRKEEPQENNSFQEVKLFSTREYLKIWAHQKSRTDENTIYEPVISALVSLKNIEIDQMNSQLKRLNSHKGNLKIIHLNSLGSFN